MLFKQIFMYYLGGFKLHREAYKRNIRMGRQNYGQIFCTQCGERIGHVISKDYKYLYLVSICKCGCEVVYQTKYENPDNTQNYFIELKNGIASCRRCGKELFYIDKRKIINCGFQVICDCGKQYNISLPKVSDLK